MSWWSRVARKGAAAEIATSSVLAVCGALRGDLAGPLNAVSHIAWGERAAFRRGVSPKYTGVGFALNGAAVTSWAALHELLFRRRPLLGGALVSALAYATDYFVVPRRVTPGFEKRLSPAGMFAVYAALALALGLSARPELQGMRRSASVRASGD
jgi:hypothetical protein